MRIWLKGLIGLAGIAVLSAAGLAAVDALDRAFPPPLTRATQVSAEVFASDGALLRAFATKDGFWRLKTSAADVDPRFLKMLVAYEDQRFYAHSGVDPYAVARAAYQFLTQGRIVSGASTLTMQVARLMEPRDNRSLPAKLAQMLRALQIERRLSKAEILDLYLTLAPYGGNLEGARAASLAYFGKEPKRLSVAEAALLVALPQSPEARRPDRFADRARAARQRVLSREAVVEEVGADEVARASVHEVPRERRQLPALAAHLAEAALRKAPVENRHATTLRKSIQEGLEAAAASAVANLPPRTSVAMIMADSTSGDIVGSVGSADYFDASRSGWIDMTRMPRSPGSTLKPFIYGLAFEDGLVAQETIIEDRPSDFFGYRPRNFDMSYQGDVSVRQALQLSLNVPAVRLLDGVGPAKLMVRFRNAGVRPLLPAGEAPGLAIGLGGVGLTLKDLVQLYAGLANQGWPVRLGDGVHEAPSREPAQPLLDPVAVWTVTDVLADVLPPQGARQLGIAYKTGTSYGYRDAWSVGYDGRYVLGVWIGRPDNGAVPGITGYGTAAPLLFDAFSRSGVAITAHPSPPPGAQRLALSDLPVGQRRYAVTASGLVRSSTREPAPQIVYPPEGARVDLGAQGGIGLSPLVLKLQGGRAPFRWLANGKPLSSLSRTRISEWLPDGAGYATLTVIDAAGGAATVRVFVE
ncbi:penicillin-binding protein 1C [Rhizobium sp. SSA_523]|uniref:penicillin-binding protein 1C n=1 Tax=Rhizobium sp. SSA_523 TaxID=2952477 RepID=UPI0020901A9E|nr:penicillin-binding protein 1C [Rhizobium sp. SSA_523]MCO5734502.1 penicillin-binding protein 1C [Rhizobium sp. SSA_523]WKC23253.1 penicillin-binding protein 1C [Rhizobium sp. SSA_523]